MASIPSSALLPRATALLSMLHRSGAPVEHAQAQALLSGAQLLGPQELQGLKQALLTSLQTEGLRISEDARKLLAEFSQAPLSSTQRSHVHGAHATRVSNLPTRPVHVPTRELKNTLSSLADIPGNLQAHVGRSVLHALGNGAMKLDHEGRTALTRFVAHSGAAAGNFSLADGARLTARPPASAPGDGVDLSGASFEDILFALMLKIANKADQDVLKRLGSLPSSPSGIPAADAVSAKAKTVASPSTAQNGLSAALNASQRPEDKLASKGVDAAAAPAAAAGDDTELQRLTDARNTTLETLSAIMKALDEMGMDSVRNLDG